MWARICTATAVLLISVSCVTAQGTARINLLMDALKMADMMQIVRTEGLDYAHELNADMLDGQGSGFWAAQVDKIYDLHRMTETTRAGLADALQGDDLDATLAFFQTATGARIVALENAARGAMGDDDVEEIARQNYRDMEQDGEQDGGARLELIRAFVAANDLLERNVSGALTSNYQFFRGLSDGHAFDMNDDEMIAEVWAQEEEIRSDTDEWLMGYLLMAYQPLSDEELSAYIAFSQTDAGQALNRGLFDGFNAMYTDISYALGRAVALELAASEL
jgi:hypothetical protein